MKAEETKQKIEGVFKDNAPLVGWPAEHLEVINELTTILDQKDEALKEMSDKFIDEQADNLMLKSQLQEEREKVRLRDVLTNSLKEQRVKEIAFCLEHYKNHLSGYQKEPWNNDFITIAKTLDKNYHLAQKK